MAKMMLQASHSEGKDSLVEAGHSINFADAMTAYRRKKLLQEFMEARAHRGTLRSPLVLPSYAPLRFQGGEARNRIIERSRGMLQAVARRKENAKKKIDTVIAAATAMPVEKKMAGLWKARGDDAGAIGPRPPLTESLAFLRRGRLPARRSMGRHPAPSPSLATSSASA